MGTLGLKGKLLDFEHAVSASTVADVQLSPDGSQVAYVTTPLSKEDLHPVMSIWLVSAEGGSSRRLTSGEGIDAGPRWSPDGKRLAFISDRKERGTPQLYVMSLGGGEAMRMTDQPGGVADPQWSPDGSKIGFLARDTDSDEEKKRKETRDDAKVIDSHLKNTGLYVVDVPRDASALAAGELSHARRLTPVSMHIGPTFGAGQTGHSWAPDSQGLVAIASRGPKADYAFRPNVIAVDLNGEITTLGTYTGVFSPPKYSPDGSTIAFIGVEGDAPAYFALNTIPANGGEQRTLVPGHNGSFHGFAWLPDGDRLLAVSEEGEQHQFRIVDPETGGATSAFSLPQPGNSGGFFGASPSLSSDGSRIAFALSTDTDHNNVWIADMGGEARRLTDLNPWTRDQDWGETRELTWKSDDGMEISGLLILPVGYQEGTRYPLLLHIHGGPVAAWSHHLYANWHDWGQFLAQRGYAVLMPNPRGSSGRGASFLKGIHGNYGEPDWPDLICGVDHMIDQGIADPEQLVVGGWSGGGYLTNVTITKTGRFKAAVSGAGIANWVSFQGTADVRQIFDNYFGRVDEDPDNHWKYSPIRNIRNATTPTLILFGEADERVPVSQGYELHEGLKSRGVETEFVAYPREPHAPQERKHQIDVLERMVAWYDRHLGRDGNSAN